MGTEGRGWPRPHTPTPIAPAVSSVFPRYSQSPTFKYVNEHCWTLGMTLGKCEEWGFPGSCQRAVVRLWCWQWAPKAGSGVMMHWAGK